ncbi:MAG: hypothetical protein HYZ11_00900 [Candidatus Tectomicrobia bacterium]|uniref:Uncharacterized protein n=1 Tax=Tectimicrobiota bacterium TaxID=2528274 RepID=A0A932ML29_UNCTE|nr:hypothetical protein [Candidatus Tectomicrobia bacterium]
MDMQKIRDNWNAAKPYLKGAAAGLIAGPLFSLYMGWVVTSGNAAGKVEAALVSARASICVARARAASTGKDPSTLDWSARSKLAEKWAVMPGQAGEAEYAVASACAEKLAEPVKEVSSKAEKPS